MHTRTDNILFKLFTEAAPSLERVYSHRTIWMLPDGKCVDLTDYNMMHSEFVKTYPSKFGIDPSEVANTDDMYKLCQMALAKGAIQIRYISLRGNTEVWLVTRWDPLQEKKNMVLDGLNSIGLSPTDEMAKVDVMADEQYKSVRRVLLNMHKGSIVARPSAMRESGNIFYRLFSDIELFEEKMGVSKSIWILPNGKGVNASKDGMIHSEYVEAYPEKFGISKEYAKTIWGDNTPMYQIYFEAFNRGAIRVSVADGRYVAVHGFERHIRPMAKRIYEILDGLEFYSINEMGTVEFQDEKDPEKIRADIPINLFSGKIGYYR